MSEAALSIFNSINTYLDLQELISRGESEGLYLECKSPSEPKLTQELKVKLAISLSGFSNTEGGVLIFGISTTKHLHSNLDTLTQIEPIGNCKKFAKEIENVIPTLTTYPVTNFKIKIVTESSNATRGVILVLILKTLGDPIQCNLDQKFYIRIGDKFDYLPYEMIKRLFAATSIPDLNPLFDSNIVKLDQSGNWNIPIIIQNKSSAVGRNIEISIGIVNHLDCENISGVGLNDVSNINPGKRVFIATINKVVHRGLNIVVGTLYIKMKIGKMPKRALKLTIDIFADNMRAKRSTISIKLAKNGFMVRNLGIEFLY